jgi:hypothetical protein
MGWAALVDRRAQHCCCGPEILFLFQKFEKCLSKLPKIVQISKNHKK